MATEACQTTGQVEELMTPNPVCAGPVTTVDEVWRTMSERRFRHMPVVDDEGLLLGIVSQRDLIRAAGSPQGPFEAEGQRPVSKVMHTEIDTVFAECCAAEAARHMLRSKRSCLPVVDAGRKLIGILTEADFLRLATRGVPPCTCGGVAVAGS